VLGYIEELWGEGCLTLVGLRLARSMDTAPPMDWPYRICEGFRDLDKASWGNTDDVRSREHWMLHEEVQRCLSVYLET
jgi:hypothetical protein